MVCADGSCTGIFLFTPSFLQRGIPADLNVLGKRAGQASEPVKILYILYLISHNINNIGDIETKQIAFSFAYPNSMFARTTLATSEWYSFRSTS